MKIPKDNQLIYAINIFIVAFLVSGVFVKKSHFFGNVHVRVASMIYFF